MMSLMHRTDVQKPGWAALIKEDYDYTRPRRGDVLEATILSVGENDLLVDLGTKQDGIVPPKDLELLDDAYRDRLKIGDRVPVVVLKPGQLRDGILVSVNKGLQQRDWLRAQEYLESEEVFEGEVTDFNRGGVIVPFGGLRGFVPNSHLNSVPRGTRGKRLRDIKAGLVGDTLSMVVIEVNQRRRRLVLSERVANDHRRQQLLQELTKGEVRTGTVRNLVDFGAFVDLGGIDGLVHISELDWGHVDHPGEVLDEGDEVDVYVLDVDRERERIALSRKRLLPDPWHRVLANLHEGDVVQGTVTSVAEFGLFVEVGEGVEGLVHKSELSVGGVGLTDVKAGSEVVVRVLRINEWEHRIGLRLERLEP